MDNLDFAAPSAAPRKKARREQHRLVVVGVDGGGTSTGVAVLDAATKELLSQTMAGPSNWCACAAQCLAARRSAVTFLCLAAWLELVHLTQQHLGNAGTVWGVKLRPPRSTRLSWVGLLYKYS